MSYSGVESWRYDHERNAYLRGTERIVLYGGRIEGIWVYTREELLVVAPWAAARDGAIELFAQQVYQLLPAARVISDPAELQSYAALLGQALDKVRVAETASMPSIEEFMRSKGWTKR